MDQLVEARRLSLVVLNKVGSTCQVVDLAVPSENKVNMKVKVKARENQDKCIDLVRELTKKKKR